MKALVSQNKVKYLFGDKFFNGDFLQVLFSNGSEDLAFVLRLSVLE